MKPTADDLNRGVAAVHVALAPKLGRLEDLYAVALRSLANIVAADLASGLTAAAEPQPGPWVGPQPDALTEELRRRHDEAWRNRHEAGIERVQIDAMRTTYGTLGASVGLDFDLRNPTIDGQVRQLRNRSTLPESSWRIVRDSLQESHDAGLGIPEAARQLRTKVAGMAPYRARMIARTELIGIANRGSITAARLAGVGGYKSWLATADARVRDAHWRANGQTVPLDNTFTVGGEELDYPGDGNGSAANVINCRCTTVYADTPAGFTGEVSDSGLLGLVPEVPDAPAPARVSEALDVQFKSPKRRAPIEESIRSIEQVHTLPPGQLLDALPVEQGGATKAQGAAYHFNATDDRGVKIRMNQLREADGLVAEDRVNFAHEFGHFIDHKYLRRLVPEEGQAAWATSARAAQLAEAPAAIVEALDLDEYATAFVGLFRTIRTSPTWTKILAKIPGEFGRYMRSPHEVFARSYAQWVTTRSGNAAMIAARDAELGLRANAGPRIGRGAWSWTPEEFEPIAAAFDAVFRAGGMIE